MALAFKIVYREAAVRDDIPALPHSWRSTIRTAIEDKLATRPDVFGKPLRRSLRGYRKLRVGDYRVVFRIAGSQVIILAIQHRSVVYDRLSPRL